MNPYVPLSNDGLQRIAQLHRELRFGDALTDDRMRALVAEWEPRLLPDARERAEDFALVKPDGAVTGIVGPRWIFHLLGLRHRAVEIALRTETGLIVLQRRSPTKSDWPDAADIAVGGHVPVKPDGSDTSYEEGAWKEIAEEIGLQECAAGENLLEGRLTRVGRPYYSLDLDPMRNPPFYNAEVRQIFAATLTPLGLARLSFADDEVAGILLVTPETAWRMLANENVASGMRYSLPRYLDWLEKEKSTTL